MIRCVFDLKGTVEGDLISHPLGFLCDSDVLLTPMQVHRDLHGDQEHLRCFCRHDGPNVRPC